MNYYFSHISNCYAEKNQLATAVHNFLKHKNRQVIPAFEIELFKMDIVKGIDDLNKTFSRCKPFECTWWKPYDKRRDWQLSLSPNNPCNFCLYESSN